MLPLRRGVDRLMEFPSAGLDLTAFMVRLTATSTLDPYFRMSRSESSAVASACMIPFFDRIATPKNPAAVPTCTINMYGFTSDDCGVCSSAAYFQVRRHA